MRNLFLVKASFTIEAAFVVPITLWALVSMILAGYRMHDIFYSNVSANEAVERYEHLSPYGLEDADSISEAENSNLDLLFSGRDYSLSLEENGDGASATITSGGESRTYEDSGFRPEKILRNITVIEEIISNG